MRIARAIALGVLLVSVAALSGCKRKKPAVPPPQAQAPTIAQPAQPEVQPPAPAASEPNRPQPEPETATVPAPTIPAPKPKPKPRKPVAKKVPPPAPAEKPAEPSKTVVSNGGTQPATPQLSASVPHDTAIHQKFTTAQLLDATDYNLKTISRQLNADEQAMVQHIRSYMQQSRDASKEGDTERAYNLALKAHLLSDELVKR